MKSHLIGKDPDSGEDGREKEKRVAEDEMFGWHHRLEQTLGDNEGQGSRALCSPWGHRVRHDLVTRQQQQQQDKVLAYSFSPTIFWGFNIILRKEWQEPLIGLSGHAVYSHGSVSVGCCLCYLFHVVIRGPVSLRLSLYICNMATVILTLILESVV